MSRLKTESGASFEEDVDAGDRGLISGNSRLEIEDNDDDDNCLLAEEENENNTRTEFPGLQVEGQSQGDDSSVDGVQIYRDMTQTSDASLIPKVYIQKAPELDKTARNQLVVVSVLCTLFIIGEVVGGVLSNSVAILTDAVHLASDLTSFIISLVSIYVAVRKPSARFTFGLYRAEVIGATVSILTIWSVTGILGYLAVKRIIHQDFKIQSDDMLVTASCCVAFNIIMALVLNIGAFKCRLPHASFGHSHGGHAHGGHSHSNHSHHSNSLHQYTQLQSHIGDHESSNQHGHHSNHRTNINITAAFIHVIGDLIQSIGILIASLIIKFKPDWKLADPVCTLLFAVMVLITTVYMLRDILSVILEATPRSISLTEVRADLRALPGVKLVSSLHVWSLTMHKTAASVHLAVALGVDYDLTVAKATHLLRTKFDVTFTTVQVMTFRSDMTSLLAENRESGLSEPI